MKKKVFLVFIVIAMVVAFFIYRALPVLKNRPSEKRIGNTIFYPDTLPKDYAILFDAQQLTNITVSSITYQEPDFPVCILSYMDQYDIVVFKKNADTANFALNGFIKVERSLITNSFNNRSYEFIEGFVGIKWGTEMTNKPLSSILVNVGQKGEIQQEILTEDKMAYIIDHWEKINLFYEPQENPDLIFELSPSVYSAKSVSIGLLLKQIKNSIYLIFVLPKESSCPEVSKELLKTLM